jgi:tRNA A-37 threonylcarbamoyl transferase component Bud32
MMKGIVTVQRGEFTLYFASEVIDPDLLIDACLKAKPVQGKGRGGIKLITLKDRRLVCRKYVHGGLFRGITRDLFFSQKRALEEMEMLSYLEEKGFPVVHPLCVLARRHWVTKSPYLLTIYEDDTRDLFEFLKTVDRKARFRLIRELARSFWMLENLGVYHPDLHLNNILVSRDRGLVFLDFDQAQQKEVTKNDVQKMFWRLDRFVEKMSKKGYIDLDIKDRLMFLRSYSRLSGYDIVSVMQRKLKSQRLLQRLGWFIDSIFYGSGK